ncbi:MULTISPECIES: aspartate aminotransferase family protein [unclassified Oceanispirochaeta]|uniref:aspartate aminotransferase family protein n=1 Tax=unclassified Oceanispirochaeta TaxID=2635722 RepID=UPI001E551CEA|nr:MULTISPECIES: acetylornithine/succinylornithine family transaminase [unclassified Oceanispirochaeta]
MSENTMTPYLIQNPPLPKNFADTFLQIDYGKGCYLYDKGGKEYLDFGSGIAVNALGYGREDLAEAAYNQMKKLIHVSNVYTTEPTVQLAETLTAAGNFAAVHFGSSGTEANEAALKYARLYGKKMKGDNAIGLISFSSGFHGRTMGALSVTATEKYKTPFGPLIPGCTILPYNDPDALKSFSDAADTAAIIVEVVQGEGGLVSLSTEMIETLNKFCAENNVILIADEVQTGLGRTGSLFASAACGLNADIITLAKPLAAGLPLSATLIPAKVNDLLSPGDHGTTFGGGPVTCQVALKVLKHINNKDFLDSVRIKGQFLSSLLQKTMKEENLKGSVLGKGLMVGLQLDSLTAEKIPAVMNECRENGLLLLRSGKAVLRIVPPLVISEKELQDGVKILFKSIKEML